MFAEIRKSITKAEADLKWMVEQYEIVRADIYRDKLIDGLTIYNFYITSHKQLLELWAEVEKLKARHDRLKKLYEDARDIFGDE